MLLREYRIVNGNTSRIAITVLRTYFLYALLFGVIIFRFHTHGSSKYLDTHPVERFRGEGICQDRVALVEDGFESGIARINLIENAQKTLDISYYTIRNGRAANVFLGCILDAADRGVQVRLILDGLFHNLRGVLKDVIYALSNHPNIQLKFYEPFSLLRPWTWNNILHDKIIIADNHLAMIGGRNIGDRYFAQKEYNGPKVDDMDVVIINMNRQNFSNSVICQMKDYFDNIWEHKFSKYPIKQLTRSQQYQGREKAMYLKHYVQTLKEEYPYLFNNSINWLDISLPTKKITLIHNPIERLNKEPWCWYDIANLINNTKKSIVIQSPYIIPTKDMMQYLDNSSANEITIFTNSIAASPNPLAISGYSRYREKIVDLGAHIYEFQGPGSIHGKSFIFDDRISLVGSFNFDSRSAYLSTETMIVIDSEEFAECLKKELENQKNNSLKVSKDYSYTDDPLTKEKNASFLKTIVIKILSTFALFFDYML